MNEKTLNIIIKAQDKASQVLEGVGGKIEQTGSKVDAATRKMGEAASFASKALGVALTGGVVAASKASWDQVAAVQQATAALGAYEKNGAAVDGVLKGLISYARSDMGVLFNRRDLFAAAQGLRIMGDNTDSLVKHVEIMSRSVGLGLSTFEGLGNVIQRVGSTGKLYADDLQFLQNAGYQLDGTLSGTSQTFESLFALLEKGIPADAMKGQAETIRGAGVRMQTAFRGIGDAILGVDAETSKFIEGGLGDRITEAMNKVTLAMKNPEVKASIAFLSTSIGTAFDFISSAVQRVIGVFEGWMPTIQIIGGWISNMLMPSLSALWNTLSAELIPALMRSWDTIKVYVIPAIGILAAVIGGVLIGAIWVAINAINAIIQILNASLSVMANVAQWAKNTGSAIGDAFIGAKNRITGIWGAIQGALTSPIESAKKIIGDAIGQIEHWISNITGRLDSFKNTASSAVSGLKGKIPNLGFASGGYTGRGNTNEVAGIVHKGEYVVPKSQVNQDTGLPMGGSTFNMYGTINLGSAGAVDKFFERLNAKKEMGSLGVGI